MISDFAMSVRICPEQASELVNIENKDHVIFADQKTGPPQRATPARELGCRANPTYDIVLAHRRRDVEGDPSGQTK